MFLSWKGSVTWWLLSQNDLVFIKKCEKNETAACYKNKCHCELFPACFNHVFTMGYLEVNFNGWLTHKIVNIENISTLKIE